MDEVIRVAIIDDDQLVGAGVAHLLVGMGLEVASVSTSIETGLERIKAMHPDVVVCDVMLDGRPTGLDLPARLGAIGAEARVVLLSSYGPEHLVDLARQSGATGYVTKRADVDALAAAIRVVATGEQVFPPVRSPGRSGPTPKEVAVIRAVADGLSTEEIAGRLTISKRTVETHLRKLFQRYGVASRTQLVVVAIRKGWITELPTGGSSPRPHGPGCGKHVPPVRDSTD